MKTDNKSEPNPQPKARCNCHLEKNEVCDICQSSDVGTPSPCDHDECPRTSCNYQETKPQPKADGELFSPPSIWTRCPSCGNTTLTINDDKHLVCTWIYCKDPTLVDRNGPYDAPRDKESLINWLNAEMDDDEIAKINARDHGEWDRFHRLEGHRTGLLHVIHHLRAIDAAIEKEKKL